MADDDAPHFFRCPITQAIMEDPVIDPDGNSYERTAISEWLLREHTSPVTRAALLPHQLKPNRALKEAIEEYLARLSGGGGTSRPSTAPAAPAAPPPDHLKCKITNELMTDPVSDPYGGNYERAAAEEFVYQRGISPVDNSKSMEVSDLKANEALKKEIEEFKRQRAAGVSGSSKVPEQSDLIAELSMRTFKETADAATLVEIKITPQEGRCPVPLDVVALIDISQSMEDPASVPQAGNSIDVGFSVLDITKHALKTVIEMLKETDRLAVISFSTNAVLVQDLTYMTRANKLTIRQRVMALQPNGCTNVWDALRLGMETLEKAERRECVSSILFMTDGRPSEHLIPPRGITPSLEKRLQRAQGVQPVIHTFGFGYDLDVPLLLSISKLGNGSFSFIPDSGFVGTVMVHWIANLSTSFGVHAKVYIEPQGGAKIKRIIGYQSSLPVNLGSLHFGQKRTLLVELEDDAGVTANHLKVSLKYQDCFGKTVLLPGEGSGDLTNPAVKVGPFEDWLEDERFRLELVHLLSSVVKNGRQPEALEKSRGEVSEFISSHKAKMGAHGAMQDVEGQVTIAVSRDEYFRLWGQPYVCSLLLAHRQQRCNNFKDKGVSAYGGDLFENQRDLADDIFMAMPPPVPSRTATSTADNAPASSTVTNNFSMSAFNDVDNPCFHADALVRLADGSTRRCAELKKGDAVAAQDEDGAARSARVVCVVRTECEGGRAKVVQLGGGLRVTPWHPVRLPGAARWHFPAELGEVREQACEAVYSFVLDAGHVLSIDGWECVGLGHGFDAPVAQHDYYGTARVIQDLAALPGYEEGRVSFRAGPVLRGADGKVLGFDAQRLCPPARSQAN